MTARERAPARRALLLAAGRGTRLGDAFGGAPKCLLELGGATLLARHVDALERVGVETLSVAVGHRAEDVEAELARLAPRLRVECIYNPRYDRGSIVSLWVARPAFACGEDALILDADVLYDPRLLERLQQSPHANCLLLDRGFAAGDEPVKLCLRAGRPVELRKRPDPALGPFDVVGESVGFFRFDPDVAARLAAAVEDYVESDRLDEPHEEALRDLLLADPEPFGVEDVTGLPWIEIDFPEDVDRARADVLPRLESR